MRRFHFVTSRVAGLTAITAVMLGASLLQAPPAVALDVPPRPAGSPIADNAGILSPDEEATLARTIQNESRSPGNQIGILTIPSLQGEALEDYSIRVARSWGIGEKTRNNGVLLLVAVQDRKIRIEVGYGLEGVLTDAQSNRIIQDRIVPQFRQQRYYQGITDGIDSIIEAIHGEKDPALQPAAGVPSAPRSIPWEGILYGLFFVPIWLGAVLARSRSWWAGGVLGGVAGVAIGFIWGFLFAGLLSIVGLGLLGLLFDWVVSRNFRRSMADSTRPSWWAGGPWIGGGSGGADGGGFGGFGGGGFGGGGSSSNW